MTDQPKVIGVSRQDDTQLTTSMSVGELLRLTSQYLPVERVCVPVSSDGKVELHQVGVLTVHFTPTEDPPHAPAQESAPATEPLASLFPDKDAASSPFKKKGLLRRLLG